jgi:hypothetical protein
MDPNSAVCDIIAIMKYLSGDTAHLGDTVKLGDGASGKIVCSMDTSEYSAEYPRSEWGYLGRGVLIESPEVGLIHHLDSDPELTMIRRAKV